MNFLKLHLLLCSLFIGNMTHCMNEESMIKIKIDAEAEEQCSCKKYLKFLPVFSDIVLEELSNDRQLQCEKAQQKNRSLFFPACSINQEEINAKIAAIVYEKECLMRSRSSESKFEEKKRMSSLSFPIALASLCCLNNEMLTDARENNSNTPYPKPINNSKKL